MSHASIADNPSADQGQRPPGRRTAALHLLAILALAAAVRIYLIAVSPVISPDGTLYIRMAQQWSADPVGVAQNYQYHVGFPAAIAGVNSLLTALGVPQGRVAWELSGQLISLVANLAATAAVWLLALMMFRSLAVAGLTGLLLAVSRPWAYSGADVLSDSLAIAFELWALVLALGALRMIVAGRPRTVAVAAVVGALAGAGYLVRLEALVALAAAVVLWMWMGRARWRLAAASSLAAVTTAALAGLPYMLAIGSLTHKKGLHHFVGSSALALAAVARYPAWRELLNKLTDAMHPVPFFMMLAWLAVAAWARLSRRQPADATMLRPQPAPAMLVGVMFVLVAPAVLLHGMNTGVISKRYMMLAGLLLTPLAAAMVWLLADVVRRWLSRRSAALGKVLAAALLLAICGGMMADAMRPMRSEKAAQRVLAERLAAISRNDDAVVCDDIWPLYYSGRPGRTVDIERAAAAEWLAALHDQRPAYVAVSQRMLGKAGADVRALLAEPLCHEVAREQFSRGGDCELLYRLELDWLPPAGQRLGGWRWYARELAEGRLTRQRLLLDVVSCQQCQQATADLVEAVVLARLAGLDAPPLALGDGDLADKLQRWVRQARQSISPAVADSQAMLAELYRAALARQAREDELAQWPLGQAAAPEGRQQILAAMLRSPEFSGRVGPIIRLYALGLKRWPDDQGLTDWTASAIAGTPMENVAGSFMLCDEFSRVQGPVTTFSDEEFVRWALGLATPRN